MIHLLLRSREGRWARDPDGNQWVLRPVRPGATNFCFHCTNPGGRVLPDAEPRWVARIPTATAYETRMTEQSVCQQCADVQHPIEERSA